jgi:hypothetical protein
MQRLVYIFTVQRPVGNPITANILSKAFGENIPRYGSLEGGDYKGPIYEFCVDRKVNIENIIAEHKYKLYSRLREYEVEEEKYNNKYYITSTFYSNEQPYKLKEYHPSGYDSE